MAWTCHVWSVLLLFCVCYSVAGFPDFIEKNGLNIKGSNVCKYPTSRKKTITILVNHVSTQTYMGMCNKTLGWSWWSKNSNSLIVQVPCSLYRPIIKTINEITTVNILLTGKQKDNRRNHDRRYLAYRPIIKTINETMEKVYHGYSLKCCLHWKRIQPGDMECKTPICPNGCTHGKCIAWTCQCDPGWQGYTCSQDIDECLSSQTNNCPSKHSICYNTPGSYGCDCIRGLRLADDAKTCKDINECEIANGGCQHRCLNAYGTYRCQCRIGYKLHPNKMRCLDTNECKTPGHGCEQMCLNTYSSYRCRCNLGYRLAPDRKKCIKIQVPDLQ